MRSLVIIPALMFAACSTVSSADLASKSPAITAHSSNSPETVAACIEAGTPGIFIPTQSQLSGEITVTWREASAGAMVAFAISPSSSGSDVAIRTFGPATRYVEKVAHCYAG